MTEESVSLVSRILPIALALIMFGLGLDLTPEDFRRVGRAPRPVFIGLSAQMLLLPAAAFLLCQLFGLGPEMSIGMMLLAASPGGVAANIFSHLARGDVALNLTLTAVNSVLSAFTLPLFVGFSIWYYSGSEREIGFQFAKTAEVFAIVLLPVLAGLWTRAKFPEKAKAADRPFRIFSVVLLLGLVIGAASRESAFLRQHFAQVGTVVLLFNLISLGCGYFLPILFRIPRRQAIATCMEIGVHNGALAMTIALSVLENTLYAVPAALYSVLMFVTAGATATLLSRCRLARIV